MNAITLAGDLGPGRIDEVREVIAEGLCLEDRRPRLRINFEDVGHVHLGMVNVILRATAAAQARGGDVELVVDPDSDADRAFRLAGIVRTFRP